jgi:hypothetical protein
LDFRRIAAVFLRKFPDFYLHQFYLTIFTKFE